MTAAISPPASPLRMTFEEFVNWAEEDIWAEWVEGEVVLLMTASREHRTLCKFLVILLDTFIVAHDLGTLFFAPFLMKLSPHLSGREPDLFFVAKANLSRLQENWLEGPADLVVEIVSPESRHRDRVDKFREYAQGGVREYWLIDLPRRQAEFFVLSAEDGYLPADIGEDGLFRSTVLDGLWLDVQWLWPPHPSLQSALEAWETAPEKSA